MDTTLFMAPAGKTILLTDYKTNEDGGLDKKAAKKQLKEDIERISDLQYKLYAENRRALLILFQAMDSGGKDSAIKHIMTGINPQGCEVTSFKHPSTQELEHNYIWRHYIHLPDRGRIGIFNRSVYENVLITKVHPELLLAENLPDIKTTKDVTQAFWNRRYRQINQFERTVTENGTVILKFFLHLSKTKQKNRFLDRIDNPDKNWKFSYADIRERQYWDAYQKAYEQAINQTSTPFAPWYIIPADHKLYAHMIIGNIIADTLDKMNIQMPTPSKEEMDLLQKGKEELLAEKE